MLKTENQMANIIYDTLMDNIDFPQFPADDISDQELVTGNCVEHPEITFTNQGISYTIIIKANIFP